MATINTFLEIDMLKPMFEGISAGTINGELKKNVYFAPLGTMDQFYIKWQVGSNQHEVSIYGDNLSLDFLNDVASTGGNVRLIASQETNPLGLVNFGTLLSDLHDIPFAGVYNTFLSSNEIDDVALLQNYLSKNDLIFAFGNIKGYAGHDTIILGLA